MKRRLIAVLMLLLTAPGALAANTREEVRAAWSAIPDAPQGSPYAEAPVTNAPYAAGELTEAARKDALAMLNFIRMVAGLEPVEDSRIYDYQCQRGAVLLAALDYVDHNAPNPGDMDENFYDSAHLGTSAGNIARFNWMRDSIIREGVAYFARDDGDANLPVLGHRRWALNPLMAHTGFGLANSLSGMSYVVMYAGDVGRADAEWDRVVWPAEGAFPAELMHDHLAWSIVPNPNVYDLEASDPTVTLTEAASGLAFEFRPAQGTGDGYCRVSLEPYGVGGCIIFRPDFDGTGFTDYRQNQHWTVRVTGLRLCGGGEATMEYTCDMISLYAEDTVNIEISLLEADLRVGEVLELTAAVIPDYADDLTVMWSTSDPSVAVPDELGRVTAIAPGACEIACEDSAGHRDFCKLTVTG